MNPLISVIVPAYNIEKYIQKCAESILKQTYKNIELIIVNDGSTDNTGAVCDEIAKNDSRVVVVHKPNGGVSSARNTALDVAKGDYISIIDGDDWVEPTLFEDAINAMQENNADAFMFEYYIDYEDHKDAHSVDSSLYGVIDREKAIEYSIDVQNRFAWSKIYSAKLTEGIRFDTDIILGEDTLYICSVLANADKVVYSSNNYYHYIVREGSAVNSAFNRKKLSGVKAYQGVVDLANDLGYERVSLISRKSLANLAVQLAKRILATGGYAEKNKDLKYLKSVITEQKKKLSKTNLLDNKSKIKFMIASISMKLLKFI